MEEKKATAITLKLLLQPQRLLHRHPFLQLVIATKYKNTIHLEEHSINNSTVQQICNNWSNNDRKLLLKFNPDEISKQKEAMEYQASKFSDKSQSTALIDRVIAKYYLSALLHLNNIAYPISWFHRLPVNDETKVRTAPCTYHTLSVLLEFEAYLQDGVYSLLGFVKTKEEWCPLSDFRRFHFLLEKNDNYWHLPLAAYECLEWIAEQSPCSWITNNEALMEQFVTPIRNKGFSVKVNFQEAETIVAVLPVSRILLSELSGTFLMFTPQFLYDGYLMEGTYCENVSITTPKETIIIQRNAKAELALHQLIAGLHSQFAQQKNGYYYLTFAEAQRNQWFIKVYHQLLSQNIELSGMDMLRHFRYSPHLAETVLTIQESIPTEKWIKANMVVAFGKEQVPIHELQKMLMNGQKAVMLKDGSLGLLTEVWLQQYAAVVKHSKVDKSSLQIPKWLALSATNNQEQQALRNTVTNEWWEKWSRWQQFDAPIYPIPTSIIVEQLRPYQHKGYDWLRLLADAGGSACLADDMGLGKTLQAICFIVSKIENQPNSRCLVVCPASLIYNWRAEFDKFAPNISTTIHHGNNRSLASVLDNLYQVIFTSYGTLRQDIDAMAAIHFEIVVMDESHHLKNPTTQITKAMQQLSSNTRLALSGTPVMNGTGDLYAQLNVLLPGLLGTKEFFKREYTIPIEQQQDQEKAKTLQRLIAPFVLRRTKEQVAKDLPEKTESILWCEMGNSQRAAYDTIKDQVRSSVMLDIEQKGIKQGLISVIAGLTKLRQICNSTALLKENEFPNAESVKSDMLINELINLAPMHKSLVFSQFTSMLNLLESDLQKNGLQYVRIDGNTPVSERQGLVDKFQAPNSKETVFLLSLKAGNAGLTLTAADYVFLFDPWWNAAVENQAIDRTHRIGQQQNVFAYRMICKNTIEEKILQMQQRKRKLADTLVSTEEGFVKGLTIEDIQFLLQ